MTYARCVSISVCRHSYLVRLLVRAVGLRVLGPLIEAVGQLIEADKIPHEHENIWFTTAAEICGGVISELTAAAVPEATRQEMWTVVMPLVEKTLPRLSLDYSDSWVDGLRLAATRRDPEALEPLAGMGCKSPLMFRRQQLVLRYVRPLSSFDRMC